MKKRTIFLAWFLTFAVLASVCSFSGTNVYGTPQSDLDSAQDELDELRDKVDEADSQIESAEEKKAELEKLIEEMDAELNSAMTEYNTLKSQQDSLTSEIEATQAQLDEATAKEDNQYEDMKLRIQYMYEVGNQSYMEILVSSENIVDFVNNASYIVELSTYDRQMLESYQQTKQTIADSKTKLEQDEAELSVLVTDAENQLNSVNSMIEEKTSQVNAYKAEIARLEGDKETYEEEIEEQTAIIAELERQASKQESAGNNSSSNNSSSSGNSGGNSSTSNPSSGGGFVWPVPASSTITSVYGYRYHPSTGKYHYHSGIDIAAPTGTSIVAASGGTVMSAGWNSSMGNYVMISHGGGVVTIYMHASSLCVSNGESVSAGQLIALVGSTGDSTGPHLHFSVRVNGSYVSPWDYL